MLFEGVTQKGFKQRRVQEALSFILELKLGRDESSRRYIQIEQKHQT